MESTSCWFFAPYFSILTLCTTLTPTPNSVAIFRIPLSRFAKACRIASSTSGSTLGLPSRLPFAFARASPACPYRKPRPHSYRCIFLGSVGSLSGMKTTLLPIMVTLSVSFEAALSSCHEVFARHRWTGWWSGLGWSVLLEMISLWLWFLAGTRNGQFGWLRSLTLLFLAGVTSAIVLAGPLYQVSRPMIEELSSARTAEKEVQLLKAEIEETRAGLSVYRGNSETRLGWQRKIGDAEAKLVRARQRLRSLQGKVADFPWLIWGPLLLQGLSLVLFQIANILAVSHIAKYVSTPGNEKGSAWKALGNCNGGDAKTTGPTEPNDSPDSLVRSLQKTLKVQLETCKMSQAEFSRTHGLNPRDVSLLFHYFQNKSDGKRNVSMQFLESLQSRFLPNDGYEDLNARGDKMSDRSQLTLALRGVVEYVSKFREKVR